MATSILIGLCTGHFLFQRGPGWPSLSLCTCGKCGSTSAYQMLHRAVLGVPFVNKQGLLHSFTEWGSAANVTDSKHPGSIHIIVYRDPVDRYISAYHSKIKCCAWSSAGNGSKACFSDVGDGHSHVNALTDCKRDKKRKPCLFKKEYVAALSACIARGASFRDIHFLPQHTVCPAFPRVPTLMVSVEQLGRLLPALSGIGLHAVAEDAVKRTHRTNPAIYAEDPFSDELKAQLRTLSEPEYAHIAGRSL